MDQLIRSVTELAEVLLSVKVTAQQLAISESQVRKLAASGALPIVRIGRSVRFRAADVDVLTHTGVRPKGPTK